MGGRDAVSVSVRLVVVPDDRTAAVLGDFDDRGGVQQRG